MKVTISLLALIVFITFFTTCFIYSQTAKYPYPIIFVHGLNSSADTWNTTINTLGGQAKIFDVCLNDDNGNNFSANIDIDVAAIGWRDNNPSTPSPTRLYAINFDNEQMIGHESHDLSNQAAIYKQGKALKILIDSVLNLENADKIILVGHSMGGLAIREYLQRTNDGTTGTPHTWWIDPNVDDGHKVAKVVTIGTPHRGSNRPVSFAGADALSEAARDLKHYGLAGVGVYLFSGDEDDFTNSFYNYDVNCNGNESDFIVGITEGNDGTTYSINMPLPLNIDYCWITSSEQTDPTGGDWAVDLERQWLYDINNNPTPIGLADSLLTNKAHWNETSDAYSITRGLDEPDTPELAYILSPSNTNSFNREIKGFITYQAGGYSGVIADNDYYRINFNQQGNLSVQLSGDSSGIVQLALFDDEDFINPIYSISNFPGTINLQLLAGTYYIRVRGLATSVSWQNPYSLTVIFNNLNTTFIESDFENDDDGWTITGNGSSTIPDYHTVGGNPGGYISDKDAATTQWYFVAPSKFLGDKSGFYGDTLSFSMKQTLSTPVYPTHDIYMVGAGITIYYDFLYYPATTWTLYSISLDNQGGWKKLSNHLPVNQSEILAVLSSLDSLRIRGDIITGQSGDTTSIDNVTLGEEAESLRLIAPNGGEVWRPTSVQNIRWNYFLVNNVKIDYTTNNGADWIIIEESIPCDGSYNWNIPNTPSNECRVRISKDTNTSINDQGDGLFTISENSSYVKSDFNNNNEGWKMSDNGSSTEPDYHLSGGNPDGYISDNDALPDIVYFFVAPSKFLDNQSDFYGHTLRYDMKVASNSNQDFPDLYLSGSGITIYYDFPNTPVTNWATYSIVLNVNAGWKKLSNDLPATQSEILAVLSALETFKITGDYFIGLPGDTTSIDNVILGEGTNSTFQLSLAVANGWNMVSAPGLHPTNQNVGTWWPHRTGTVWGFNGVQYVAKTVTTPGEGYWMKNTLTETYNYPAIQIVPHNPVPVTLGWNMIGGYETSPTVANLKLANPQITGTVWGFNGVQYVAATNLVPGYSYWAKVTAAGNITIPDAMAKGSGEVVEYFKEDWGRITITDAAGISTTLYAVKGEVDLEEYAMPPLPPSGAFDIRFSSERIAEDINNSVQSIDMVGVTYPLTVRVENMDIRLMDETGKILNANLKDGEDIVISDATINKLIVSGELIPDKYALEQNYPNPFNPITTIKFSLPEATDVTITIYNVLGEKVTELVNTALTAGKYSYQWNAQNVATGMYIYELRTDKFVSVKKMILLK